MHLTAVIGNRGFLPALLWQPTRSQSQPSLFFPAKVRAVVGGIKPTGFVLRLSKGEAIQQLHLLHLQPGTFGGAANGVDANPKGGHIKLRNHGITDEGALLRR